jgi:hypothetical protein
MANDLVYALLATAISTAIIYFIRRYAYGYERRSYSLVWGVICSMMGQGLLRLADLARHK